MHFHGYIWYTVTEAEKFGSSSLKNTRNWRENEVQWTFKCTNDTYQIFTRSSVSARIGITFIGLDLTWLPFVASCTIAFESSGVFHIATSAVMSAWVGCAEIDFNFTFLPSVDQDSNDKESQSLVFEKKLMLEDVEPKIAKWRQPYNHCIFKFMISNKEDLAVWWSPTKSSFVCTRYSFLA